MSIITSAERSEKCVVLTLLVTHASLNFSHTRTHAHTHTHTHRQTCRRVGISRLWCCNSRRLRHIGQWPVLSVHRERSWTSCHRQPVDSMWRLCSRRESPSAYEMSAFVQKQLYQKMHLSRWQQRLSYLLVEIANYSLRLQWLSC